MSKPEQKQWIYDMIERTRRCSPSLPIDAETMQRVTVSVDPIEDGESQQLNEWYLNRLCARMLALAGGVAASTNDIVFKQREAMCLSLVGVAALAIDWLTAMSPEPMFKEDREHDLPRREANHLCSKIKKFLRSPYVGEEQRMRFRMKLTALGNYGPIELPGED